MNTILCPRLSRLSAFVFCLAWFGMACADEAITVTYPANIYNYSMSDQIDPIQWAPGCFGQQSFQSLIKAGLGGGESTDWDCIRNTFQNVSTTIQGNVVPWSATDLGSFVPTASPDNTYRWDAPYTAHTPNATHPSTATVKTFCKFGGSQAIGALVKPGFCLLQPKPDHDKGCQGGECTSGNPITIASGNKFQSVTDYKGGGPFPLTITRAYNSSDANANNDPENIGFGWRVGFGEHLVISHASAPLTLCQDSISRSYYYCPVSNYLDYINNTEVTVIGPDGNDSQFTYPGSTAPDGTQFTNEQTGTGALYFVGALPSPASGPGFRYVGNDGVTNYYDSTGELVIKQSPGGLRHIYAYVNGQLSTITDSGNRSLTFQYDPNDVHHHIQTITDPDGGIYRYGYQVGDLGDGNLTSVTYPDGSFVTYVYSNRFDIPHALVGLIDEDKTALNSSVQYATWDYDTQGRAKSSQHAGGVDLFQITYTTDVSGTQVTSAHVTEPTGLTRDVSFAAINFRTLFQGATQRCSACGDDTQSMTYDANGFVASKTRFNTTDVTGQTIAPTTTYVHDNAGLELSRTEGCVMNGAIPDCNRPEARTITTQWDPTLRQPTLITEPGRTTAYTYDAFGNVLTKTVTDTTTSVARTTTYTYNAQGLLETLKDPRGQLTGKVTRYDYDTSDNLITVTNTLGQQTHITYGDSSTCPHPSLYSGLPHTITDANGVTTVLCYDQRQRLTSRTVDGAETDYLYDPAGQLIQVTLPLTGNGTRSVLNYTYDDAHRLTDITDFYGDKIHYGYDSGGNRNLEETRDPSNALQKTLTRNYNNINQLISVVTTGCMDGLDGTQTTNCNATQTTVYTPDAQGNVTSIVDPRGNITTQGFDALNRLAQVVDPQTPSGNTNYNYDALDHVQEVIDPNGLATHYHYDAFGDVTEQDSPDTGTTLYTYNLDGNRLSKTDARGVMATYTYDDLNRLTSISYPDASRNVTYAYDNVNLGDYGIGRLYSVTDATGITTYSYDSHGNTRQKTVTPEGRSFSLSISYDYDAADNLTGMTYPSGMHVSFVRDAMERVTEVDASNSSVPLASNIGYEPFGPIKTITYGNGLLENRSYDLNYKLLTIASSGVQGLGFEYDANGNITKLTDSRTPGNLQTLAYDSMNRLTSANGAYGNQSYSYDADGNRIQQNFGGTVTLFGYAYQLPDGGGNQLMTVGAANYQYDAMGDTIDDGILAYNYDVTGRLTGYGPTGSISTATDYLYNGLGQRAVKFPVDDVAPTVSITSPTGSVSGTVTVTASVADDFGVSSVQFQLDGANFGSPVTTAPFQVSWNTLTASVGSHVLTATAVDPANNSATSAPVTVDVLDVTPPTVAVSAPANNASVSGTAVTLSATAADNVGVLSVQFQVDGANVGNPITTAPYSLAWDSTTVTIGAHAITAVATDTSGNTSTSTAINITVLDGIAPTVAVTAPASDADLPAAGNVMLTATASDNVAVASVQFQLDGINVGSPVTAAPYTWSWNTSTASGGSHVLTAVATDTAGNATTSAPVTVTVDESLPTIAITAPATGSSLRGTVTVSASASDADGITSVQFQLDGANLGAPVTAASYTVSWDTTTATEGSHGLTAIATDEAGNAVTSTAVTVSVDNTPPTASITAPAGGADVSGTTTVTAMASDNIGVASVQFMLDGVDLGGPVTAAPYAVAWDTTTAAAGSHTLTAVASDTAGNATTSAAVDVTVQDITPPMVSITNPVAGDVSGKINLNVDASDNVGVTSVQYQLDGVDLGDPVTTAPFSLTWDTNTVTGSHTLTAIASDAAGNTTTSAAVTLTATTTPPTVPTSMHITNNGDGTFTLSWSAPAGATQYRISRSTNDGSWVWVDTLTDDDTGTISRLEPQSGSLAQGDYSFHVSAWNAAGGSGPGTDVSGVVMTTVPAKPTSMSITPGTSTNGKFTLSWTAPPAATQYRVFESANGGNYVWVDTFNNNNLGTISRQEPQSGSFGVGTYSFHVCAWNTYGCSQNSSTVTGTVSSSGGGGCPPPPYQCQLILTDDFAILGRDPSAVGSLPLGEALPTRRIQSGPDGMIAAVWGGDLDRRRPGPVPLRLEGAMDLIHKNGLTAWRADT